MLVSDESQRGRVGDACFKRKVASNKGFGMSKPGKWLMTFDRIGSYKLKQFEGIRNSRVTTFKLSIARLDELMLLRMT